MMRALAMALLLVSPLVATGQGLTLSPPGGAGKSKPLITPDANVVSQVWWPKSTITETKSVAWSMNGTVPVSKSSLFKTARSGAGAFSTSNWYVVASPNALQFSGGTYTVCWVFAATAGAAAQMLGGNHDAVATGWMVMVAATTGVITHTSSTAVSTANAITAGVNVACAGRSGGTSYVKLNGGTTASASIAYTVPTGRNTGLGMRTGSSSPMLGTIYEFYGTTTAWDDTTIAALQASVLAQKK